MEIGLRWGGAVLQAELTRGREEDDVIDQDHFNLIGHLHRQIEFSTQAFGPADGSGPVDMESLIDHILKELRELIDDHGSRVEEWIDLAILAFDGAWRMSGASPAEIAAALQAKEQKNEGRRWPDWRTAPRGVAIEHVRTNGYDHDLVAEGLISEVPD
jgi:hypothetical protein